MQFNFQRLDKKMAITIFIALFFIIIDRFLKILALYNNHLQINIIGDWLNFNFTKNYNIAFSLPLSGFFLNILISFIILALTYVWLKQSNKKNFLLSLPLTFVVFGAISNLLDRFLYGYVIDYISLKYFTVFNVADIMITGAGIYLLFIIKKINQF